MLSVAALLAVVRLSSADPIDCAVTGTGYGYGYGFGYDFATGGNNWGYGGNCVAPTATPPPGGGATVTATASPTATAAPAATATVGTGTTTITSGSLTVAIPAGALPAGTNVTLTAVTPGTPAPAGSTIVNGFAISFTNAAGNPVTLQAPITFTFTLAASGLSASQLSRLVTDSAVFQLLGGKWVPLPFFKDTAAGKVSALVSQSGTVALMNAPMYEVLIEPGLNLIPWTGASDTPVEYAFGATLNRFQIIWRFDVAQNQWMRYLPGQAALSNFTTLQQFDSVYVILTGQDAATVRMVVP